MPFLKLGILFALVVVLLRFRVTVGPAVMAAAILGIFLLGMSYDNVLLAAKEAVTLRFADLTSSIVLMTMLGELMRRVGFLDRLTDAARLLPGGERSAVVALPAAIGMMPMPGGAFVSAPLVEAVLAKQQLSGQFKTVMNYWFRHMVEFSWPLYPSLVLMSGILHIPIMTISFAQLPLTLLAATIGFFTFLPKVAITETRSGKWLETLTALGKALWPILLVVALMATHVVPMGVALIVSLIATYLIARPSFSVFRSSIFEGLKPSLLIMVFSILFFERVLSTSGILSEVNVEAMRLGIPGVGVVVITCFLIGLLTSMSAAVVGLGFTLAAPFLYQPELQPQMLTFGYLAGFVGMMISPTHLCLVLTSKHFGVSVPSTYRAFALPLIILSILGLLYCFSPLPEMVYGYFAG